MREHLTVARGGVVNIDAHFRTKPLDYSSTINYSDTSLVDPVEYNETAPGGPKFTILDPFGTTKQSATLFSSRLSRGVFRYSYTVPSDGVIGTWTAVISDASYGGVNFSDEDGTYPYRIPFTVILAPSVSKIGDLADSEKTLCQLQDVKSLLQDEVSSSDTSYDSLLNFLIKSCSSIIRTATSHMLTPQNYYEKFWLERSSESRLLLREYPVISLIRVRIDGQEYDLSYFLVTRDGELLRIDGDVFPTQILIDIVYRAGYDPIPDDLRLACAQLVALVFKDRKTIGLISERIGSYSYRKVEVGVGGFRADPRIGRDIEYVIAKYSRCRV